MFRDPTVLQDCLRGMYPPHAYYCCGMTVTLARKETYATATMTITCPAVAWVLTQSAQQAHMYQDRIVPRRHIAAPSLGRIGNP